MTTTEAVSLAGACVSVLALLWSVISWRRAGAHVLARAAVSGSIIRVIVTNAGRTPDAVCLLYIGGRVLGVGRDVSATLSSTVHKLEAASPVTVDICLDPVVDAELIWRCQQGFESVFIGLGSLRHLRADVVPVPLLTAATGHRMWRRPCTLRRYGPLTAAVCAATAASTTTSSADLVVVVTCMLGVGYLVGGYFTMLRRQMYTRARVERWLTCTGFATAILLSGSAAEAGVPDRRALVAIEALLVLGIVCVLPTVTASGIAGLQLCLAGVRRAWSRALRG